MYDKEKENLKSKITKLTNELSACEKEKENSNELIQSSLREVSNLYGQKVDYLQKELLDTRTEASTRLIVLTKELNKAQTLIKEQEEHIGSLKQKMRDARYQHDISQKSAGYKLEKSE
jgi:cell division septum initiation protein DivIVA